MIDPLPVWAHLEAKYGTQTIPKEDSLLMWFIGLFLSLIGIMTTDEFRGYTTTIGTRIYLANPKGEGGFPEVKLALHEHIHIYQGRRDGWTKFTLTYLLSSKARAKYEMEAYGTGIAMDKWHIPGAAIYPQRLAAKLLHYGCSATDVDAAQAYYKRVIDGHIPNSPVTADLIDYLTPGVWSGVAKYKRREDV